jgi:hypothetical protein
MIPKRFKACFLLFGLRLCLAVVGIVIVTSFVVRGRSALRGQGTQESTKVNLSVQDPRPLAKAIETLEAKYGWVITYEDPRYTHASEITDVTETVRRDLKKFKPGRAPKVLIPKGGTLSFEYDEALTVKPADQVVLVQELINSYSATGNAGRFRVEHRHGLINVIPTAVKNTAGDFAHQTSLLDAIITVPAEQRSGMKTLQAICAAISQATGTRVLLVGAPLGMFLRYRDDEEIASQRAGDALANLLGKVGNQVRLSWQLLYDPGLKVYTLNIHQVPPHNR